MCSIVYMQYNMINIWYMRSYLLSYLSPSAKIWSVLVILVILRTRTETRTDFDIEEELLSLIYLVLLYYVLVVLVVLVKSKVLRKFSKLFLWYTFDIYIYMWYMLGYAYRKKSKKSYKSQFFLGQLGQLGRVFEFLFIWLKNTI